MTGTGSSHADRLPGSTWVAGEVQAAPCGLPHLYPVHNYGK